MCENAPDHLIFAQIKTKKTTTPNRMPKYGNKKKYVSKHENTKRQNE